MAYSSAQEGHGDMMPRKRSHAPWLVASLLLGALAGMTLSAPVQAQIAFRAAAQANSAAGQPAPTFQAAGTAVSGTAAVTPAWPAHAVDDVALLFVESAGGEAATLSTAAGFVAVTGSPQATGATTAGTRITVFWARATSTAMPSPTVADPGDHVYAQILTYRGVIATGNPWDITGGGVKAAPTTSVTVTSVTTTGPNDLIVQAVARDINNVGGVFSLEANGNLTGITERSDAGTGVVGNGGGFVVWDGVMATAGATGSTGATVLSSINAFLTIALSPPDSVLTINVPAGTLANDVMIASVSFRPCSNVSAAACTTTITSPAGWTQVNTVSDQTTGGGTGGFGNRLFVYQHVATGAEPASYTWTFGGEVVHAGAVGGILSFSGVDTINPVIVQGGALIAAATNNTAPTLTIGAVTGVMLVTTHSNNSSTTWTSPAGMTSRVNIASLTVPDDLGLSVQVNNLANAPSPTVARQASWTAPPAADTGVANALALRPALVTSSGSRILNDNAGRTPVAAENVDVVNWTKTTKFLVTIGIQTSAAGGDCRTSTGANKLQWSNVTDAPGVWNNLGTAAGPEMILFNSANLTTGNDLTAAEAQVTGTGTYVNGEEAEVNTSTTWTNRVRNGDNSAIQFAIDPSSGIDGKEYQFRFIVDTLCAVTAGANVVSVSVTLAVPVVTPGSFNAFETSTAAAAITGKIFTKLVGTAFSLDVVAISAGAQLATFTNSVSVELLANTTGAALDAQNCPTVFTSIQGPTTVTITAGRSTVNFAAVASAYRNVRVRIRFPVAGPTVTSCSTDNFAIRPQSFSSVTSTNATQTNTSGTPIIKTGANFNLTATSVAGYDGAPSIDNTQVVGTPTAGSIGGSFGAAPIGTGTATGASFTYTEVGNFGLNANAVFDSTFTGVDTGAADCVVGSFSNVLSGAGKYGCSFGSVAVTQSLGVSGFGRFIPDHFALTAAGSLTQGCSSGGFTYLGQRMTFTGTTIEARNSTNVKTNNYAGSYAKLTPATFSAYGFGARDSGGSGFDLTSRIDPGSSTSSVLGWNSGQLAFAVTAFSITKLSPEAPWAATNIGIAPADSDAVTMQTSDFNIDVDASGTSDHARVGGASTNWLFGRLRLLNALGSERLSLAVSMQTEIWNGFGFVVNAADNCTTIAPANIGLGSYKQNLSSGETSVTILPVGAFSSGTKTMTLSAPGVGNNGSVDVVVNLDPSTTVSTCNTLSPVPTPTGADMTYLRSTWCGAPDHDPVARANFGLYGGGQTKQPIYTRENY